MQRSRLLIKTIDRTANSTSSANFKIELPASISGDWLVRYVHMPNALYNVVTGLNDTVYTSLGNATLTAGYYTATTFTTMLVTRLQVANVNFAATFDTDTKKLTITNLAAFTLNFATTAQSAARLLGFPNADTASAASQVATNTINLIASPSVVIDVAECTYPIDSTDVVSSARGHVVVPFTVAYGGYERIGHNDLYQCLTFPRPTKNLTVRLYDTDGNAASLNGADWEMLLQQL